MEHDKHFNGEIRRTAEESTPSWGFDESVLARRPNIVMVVLDFRNPILRLFHTIICH